MPSGLTAKPAPGSGGESNAASIFVPGGGLSAPLVFVAGVPLGAVGVALGADGVPLATAGVVLAVGVPLAEGCGAVVVCCLAFFRASLAAWIGFGNWASRVHTNRAVRTVARAKARDHALPDFELMNVIEAFSS